MSRDSSLDLGDFEVQCLSIADEVARTGRPVTITRLDRPLVELVPAPAPRPLEGSVEFLVADEALRAPIDVEQQRPYPQT